MFYYSFINNNEFSILKSKIRDATRIRPDHISVEKQPPLSSTGTTLSDKCVFVFNMKYIVFLVYLM